EVVLVLANPAAGIEPMRRTAVPAGDDASHWRIDDLRVPVAGRWQLRVEILIGPFERLTVEDTVALPHLAGSVRHAAAAEEILEPADVVVAVDHVLFAHQRAK